MAKPGGGIGLEFGGRSCALDVEVPRLAPSMFVCVCDFSVFIVPHTNDSETFRDTKRQVSYAHEASAAVWALCTSPTLQGLPVQGAFPSSQG